MELYGSLKQAHATLAFVSMAGLLVRWALAATDDPRARHRAARVVPHVLDTLLLASGASLAILLAASPLSTPWLGAKLTAVVGYVLAGAVALRRARSTGGQAAIVVAGALFAYVVSVVLNHHPVPWS